MNNWPTKKLGEICEIIAGQAPSSEFYNNEGRGKPFLKVNSFGEIYPRVDTWTTKSIKESKIGDVLFSVAGSLGLVNLGIDACITRSIFALRPDSRYILQKYLFYLLKIYGKKIAEQGQGSAQKIITIKQIENFEIPLPPLPVQQKIVYVLDAIQSAVQVQEKIIEKTKELKKSLMYEIFNPKPKTQKSKLKFKIKKWREVRLGDVAKIERGKFTYRPRNDPMFYGGQIPFIQTGDVVNSNGYIRSYTQTLNDKGLSVSKLFSKGTIVITIAGNIGYVGILEFDSAFPDSLIGITPNEKVDRDYLMYYLSAQQPKMEVEAPRGTQKNFNIQLLSVWPVILPPLDEQQEIADILQTVDQKIEIEQKKKMLYEELFKTVLNKIFKGEINVEKVGI